MTTAMILRFSKHATVSLPTSRSVIAAGGKAIRSRPNRGDTCGIVSPLSSCQTPVGPALAMAVSSKCVNPASNQDEDTTVEEIADKFQSASMGRANAGKRKISEIEVDRFQELIKDVPENELHAALEDSDIDEEGVSVELYCSTVYWGNL